MIELTNQLTQPLEPTLESVGKAFAEWRRGKMSPGERIPQHLWDLVRPLISQHKITTISKCLHIYNSQMIEAGILSRPTKNSCQPFVNVELSSLLKQGNNAPQSPAITIGNQFQLIMERHDGRRLIVNAPTESQAASIVQQFWS